jgi:hypothetical protein
MGLNGSPVASSSAPALGSVVASVDAALAVASVVGDSADAASVAEDSVVDAGLPVTVVSRDVAA